MNIFEKVSKGLECCISLNGGPMDHDCKECPYNVGNKDDTCISIIPMLEDALKVLKELKRIASIAYDYDRHNSIEELKSLMDEIREIAIKAVQTGL